MKTLILFLICFISISINAQEVDKMPLFPGCSSLNTDEVEQCAQQKLIDFLSQVKYPKEARENNISGRVFIKFLINEDGCISQVTVASENANALLANAAVDHVKTMPCWEPAEKDGLKVATEMVAPFNFALPAKE